MAITLTNDYFGRIVKGGSGSGNFGHGGRPGEVGGSGEGGHLETLSTSWQSSMTGKEKQALKSYTGTHFAHVNDNLRHPDPVFSSAPSFKERIANIDKAIAKSTLTEPVTLYRGVGDSGNRLANLQPGQVFSDKAFVSASLDKAIAERFGGTDHVVIRMSVSAGHSAAVLGNFSKYPAEKELLLPRGSKFEVTGSEKQGAFTYVDVKVK